MQSYCKPSKRLFARGVSSQLLQLALVSYFYREPRGRPDWPSRNSLRCSAVLEAVLSVPPIFQPRAIGDDLDVIQRTIVGLRKEAPRVCIAQRVRCWILSSPLAAPSATVCFPAQTVPGRHLLSQLTPHRAGGGVKKKENTKNNEYVLSPL